MKNWITGILLAGLCAGASAQIDWPTFRGQNTRTGVNANPIGANTGVPTLRWYFPLQGSVGRNVTVDNAQNAPAYTETAITRPTWRTPTPDEESPDFFAPANVLGSLANPYRWHPVVASTAGTGNPTAGATATAQWTLTTTVGVYYAVSAWFPSSGTFDGLTLVPNSEFAVYKIEYDDTGGVYKTFLDIVPHVGGGNWVRLGNNRTTIDRIFRSGQSGTIRVTLYNTVPRDDNDNLLGPVPGHIVCADGIQAVPAPGSIHSSPVVKNVGPTINDVVAYIARNQGRVDPTDPSGTRQLSLGNLHAVDARGTNIGKERWSWSPNLVTSFNTVLDNLNPAFNPDPGWSIPGTTAPGFFASNYVTAPVVLARPGTARAVWTPSLAQDGFYDVYAWFPRSGGGELHARAARYVVDENGTQTEVLVDQDVQGGNWIRLGTRPFFNNTINGGLKVEVWNYSDNPGDTGRVVCADAVMFVGQYTGAIFSTPTVATVNLKLSGGAVTPTDCVFLAAEDGHIYCLDARGNGNGSTTLYWSYPSIPDNNNPNWVDPNDVIDGPAGNRIPWPSGFGVSSMCVQNVNGKDLLYIAAKNGRVYAIDCQGRGDYDATSGKPGTAQREWTWPKAKYTQATNRLSIDPARPAFVASTAFDPVNKRIFAAGTEGRIFALDAAGNNDQTTTNAWAYPTLSDPPVGAISSTPVIGGGRVIFPSFDGYVYARDLTGAQGTPANWQYPATAQPALQPFQYTSVCYVTAAQLGGGVTTDLCYFINENGIAYAVQGNDGTLSWQANEVFGGAQSSPSFAHITPPGTGVLNVPIITFGDNVGEFLGLYALPGTGPGRQNSAGGKLAWGYQSAANHVFASPAVSYNTDGILGNIFHAGEDGYLYAFREGGLITVDPGFIQPPGQVIDTPDDQSTTDFVDTKIKLISRNDYNSLRQPVPTVNPVTVADVYGGTPVIEFGEKIYVLAYNFKFDPMNPVSARFRMIGPGGLNLQFDRPVEADPFNSGKGFAVMAIPINYSGPNFITPGDIITIDVQFVKNNRIINPPVPPRQLTVANPLAVTTVNIAMRNPPANKSIGWSSDPNFVFNGTSENHINGSNDKAIMSSAGAVGHGQSANTSLFITDRSRVLDTTGRGIGNVRAVRSDGVWQGGSAAVIKPLPYTPSWEEMPFSIPNLSRDYPDIDRSQLTFTADPNGAAANPLLTPIFLASPTNYDPNNPQARVLTGVRFAFDMEVPRFQPANLTKFTDTAGTALEGGYRSKALIYVDSNGNGRPDGQAETLVDLPPGSRREPYRSFNIGGSVPVDEKMHIVEPTVDLGSSPHSLGYTPAPPWTLNGFIPDISTGAPFANFFKPFTVINDGNVNMLDLRIATRIGPNFGANPYSVAFNSDANDTLAWLDGRPNIITNLNPPYAPNNGALDPSGNPRVTLHKARPGDRAGTSLTVPDVPYGITAPVNSRPVIGVAAPLGFPVGEFSQLINVIEDNYLVGGSNDRALDLDNANRPVEAYTDQTMRVKFLIRESRMTGGRTTGTATQVDDNLLVPSNFNYTNSQPSAFRDPSGTLHMIFAANRPGPANVPAGPQQQDVWTLFFSRLTGSNPGTAIRQAGNSPFRDLMSWGPAANNRFFTLPDGPRPTEAATTLFATPGASFTIVRGPVYGSPSFPVNARTLVTGTQPYETAFWSGKAGKDDSGDNVADFEDNRIFYTQYSLASQGIAPTQWIAYDTRLEKKRIRPLDLPNPQSMAIFWYGDVNGVSRMFMNARMVYSATAGDQTNNWSNNIPINPGDGFASAKDPQPILRSNNIDLVFTGMLKDRPQPEVFYARFRADLQTRIGTGRLGDLINLPERNRETLSRDSGTGTYRARGVNWDTRGAIEVWLRRPNQAPIRVDVANTRTRDENQGIFTSDSELGGKLYIDPNVGTVRFTSAPSSDTQVELRYTPRVIRVSELGNTGGHSNPSSFLDQRFNWDRDFYFRSGGTVIQTNDMPTADRMWHIYERGATGPGQTKRPYMKTQRLQVRLNHPVALNNAAGVVSLSVAGMAGQFYQVDPGNARVYFQVADEGRPVTINYQWRDANGNLQNDTAQGLVMWQTESAEKPVPIEQAIDEGTVFAFADPFQGTNFDPSSSQYNPRTGLVWVFFTSTRGGTRDVYYLTLAPRLSPVRFP